MMRRIVVRSAIAVAALWMFTAAPASAQEVTVCVDVYLEAQGQVVVDEDECVTLPPPPG
jgi:hypothetical protein